MMTNLSMKLPYIETLRIYMLRMSETMRKGRIPNIFLIVKCYLMAFLEEKLLTIAKIVRNHQRRILNVEVMLTTKTQIY